MKEVLSNTGVQILGKVVMVVVGFLTTGILTRRLGVEVYGDYLLIQSLLLVVGSFSNMGTGVIGVRELSRKKEEKKFLNIVFLRKFLSLGAIAGLVLFSLVWSPLSMIRLPILIGGLTIFLISFLGDLGIVFQVDLKMGWKSLLELLSPVLIMVGLIWWADVGLVEVMIIGLLVRLLVLGIGKGLVKGLGRKIFSLFSEIDWKLVKKIFVMSWPMGLYLLVFTSYDKMIDSLMIRHFLGREGVAWYGLAYKVYSNLVMPAYFLVSSVFPLLSKKKDNGQLVKQGLIVLLGMVVMGLPLVWMGAGWIMEALGGEGFYEGVQVLKILGLALGFSYVNHMFGFLLIARDGQKKMLSYGLIAIVFNLALNLLVIPVWGINGAAGVTIATEGLMTILLVSGLRPSYFKR